MSFDTPYLYINKYECDLRFSLKKWLKFVSVLCTILSYSEDLPFLFVCCFVFIYTMQWKYTLCIYCLYISTPSFIFTFYSVCKLITMVKYNFYPCNVDSATQCCYWKAVHETVLYHVCSSSKRGTVVFVWFLNPDFKLDIKYSDLNTKMFIINMFIIVKYIKLCTLKCSNTVSSLTA